MTETMFIELTVDAYPGTRKQLVNVADIKTVKDMGQHASVTYSDAVGLVPVVETYFWITAELQRMGIRIGA